MSPPYPAPPISRWPLAWAHGGVFGERRLPRKSTRSAGSLPDGFSQLQCTSARGQFGLSFVCAGTSVPSVGGISSRSLCDPVDVFNCLGERGGDGTRRAAGLSAPLLPSYPSHALALFPSYPDPPPPACMNIALHESPSVRSGYRMPLSMPARLRALVPSRRTGATRGTGTRGRACHPDHGSCARTRWRDEGGTQVLAPPVSSSSSLPWIGVRLRNEYV